MKKILFLCAVASVAAAHAQVFDNTGAFSSTTIRNGYSTPALKIENTNAFAINLTSVAFQGQNFTDQLYNFFLADSSGNILDNVLSFEFAGAAHTLYGAGVSWSLLAGQTYYIGAVAADGNGDFDYLFPPPPTLQNGLQAHENGNFNGFLNPQIGLDAGAEMQWRLNQGRVLTPEPITMSLGAAGIGLFIRRRKAKKA